MVDPTDQTAAAFGEALAGGDVNGDGYADLVVGAPGWSGEASGEGRAYAFAGGPAGLSTTPMWTADPTDQTSALFGSALAVIDVNADGYADAIIGAENWDSVFSNEGRAYLYLGGPSGLADEPAWVADPSDQATAEFGRGIGAAGDVNGDGYGDVVIAAPEWAGDAVDEGRAYVYLGNAEGLDLEPVLTIDPSDRDEAEFGGACGGVGDVNDDGYADFVVGAPDYDEGGSGAGEGRAYLYLGGPAGPAAAPAWFVDSADDDDADFGVGVASAGDLDADGFADIAIAADDWDGPSGSNEGAVFVYLGADTLPSQTPSTLLAECGQSQGNFGAAVSGAGDVDGDGYPELLVGCRDYTGEATEEGRAFLFPGGPAGLTVAPIWLADPTDQSTSNFGASAAGLGDVNGDGLADIAVGALGWSGEASDEGRVFVFYGRADGKTPGRQLAQLDSDAATAVDVGATIAGDAVVLTGRVTQEGPVGGRVRLEVEVVRVAEPFTGAGERSEPVITGTVASVAIGGLTDGAYRWRARVVYPVATGTGAWTEFGDNAAAEPDFVVDLTALDPDAGPPAIDAGPDTDAAISLPTADAGPTPPAAADDALDTFYGCRTGGHRDGGPIGALLAAAFAALACLRRRARPR